MSVHQLRNIKCEGGILEVCNYIGSYCHAEILTSRKRRDTGNFCLVYVNKFKILFSIKYLDL